MDTGQSESTSSPGGQPLTQMYTSDKVMPFQVLINSDVMVSLMSLHVFLTMQIPISSLTPVSSV
jgi:hypothetical protein